MTIFNWYFPIRRRVTGRIHALPYDPVGHAYSTAYRMNLAVKVAAFIWRSSLLNISWLAFAGDADIKNTASVIIINTIKPKSTCNLKLVFFE
ncbi:hypothetical protein [Undibacterium sp. Tian12W]|uniref:hypothetical protein n=1 Tax=Undibacterium sp. Tian12W TaxID=3413054 RepID=UPI003BF4EBDA